MKRRLIIVLAFASVMNHSWADVLDSGFTVEYQVQHNDIRLGITTQTLRKLNSTSWEYQGEAIPKGFVALFVSDRITEKSSFTLHNNIIRPLHYQYLHRKSRNRERKIELQFDWDKKTVQSIHENKIFELPDNTQDFMTFQLHLMRHLQSQQTPLTIPIATRKAVTNYPMQIRGEEKLEVPAGEYTALKLDSQEADKDRYTLWFAKSLDYLPIKIEKIDKDGDHTTFELQSFTRN
jgi:Protein of unknown function (DUF3108)